MAMNQDFYTTFAVHRNKILARGYLNGKRYRQEVKYTPTLYISDAQGEFQTLQGKPLKPIQFDSIWDAREFSKDHPDVYGYTRWDYVWVAESFPEDIQFDQSLISIGVLDIETEISGDIENTINGQVPITAITYRINNEYLVFGLGEYTVTRDDVRYFRCEDEKELLFRFLMTWSSEDYCPDIITGWNIEGFDIPVIVNRARTILGDVEAARFSPWRLFRKKQIESYGKLREVEYPVGIEVLDWMHLYKKLAVGPGVVDTPDDYKLNTVAHNELKQKKLDFSEYSNLMDLWSKDHQKFIDYNIIDVELVWKLEQRRELIKQVINSAYEARCNYEDILGTVRPWECIIHHYLLQRKIIMPPRTNAVKKELVGGYVKDPDPGMYEWVVSLDLNSLYPMLQIQYNISPETRVGHVGRSFTIEEILDGAYNQYADKLKEHDLTITANGYLYKRAKGFIPDILQGMYDERVLAKKRMLEAEKKYVETKDEKWSVEQARNKNVQMVKKVFLNGGYGALTNAFFILFDHPNAEAITTSGQLSVKWIERRLNAYMNKIMHTTGVDYVIGMDTDSVYLHLGEFVKKFCVGMTTAEIVETIDNFTTAERRNEKGEIVKHRGPIAKIIEEGYKVLGDYMNAAAYKMEMKRESIIQKAIWVGKKNYILSIWDKEGVLYKEPKLEMKGVQAIKASTPSGCRQKLQDAIKLIMADGTTEQDVVKFVDGFYNEFAKMPLDEIAFPRSINGMDQYTDSLGIYKKGTPIQVRGALLHNDLLERYNFNKYPKIFNGDKARYVYLRMPNVVRENVISFPGPLPAELKIEELVDRDKQFDKGFIKPLEKVLNAIGWGHESVGNTLDV